MKVSYSYSYSILFSKESICSSRRTKVFLLQQPKKMYTQYISELLFIILNKKNTLDKSILLLLLSYHFYLFFFYLFFHSLSLFFLYLLSFHSTYLYLYQNFYINDFVLIKTFISQQDQIILKRSH